LRHVGLADKYEGAAGSTSEQRQGAGQALAVITRQDDDRVRVMGVVAHRGNDIPDQQQRSADKEDDPVEPSHR
jgi:hypothetical protein